MLPPKGANSGAAILVFPGGGFSILAMGIEGTEICDWVTARGMTDQAPPTFRLQAWDDPVDRIGNSTVYVRALDAAGVRAEVHLFAKGGHAFGVRPTGHPGSSWPALVENWLDEIEVL